MGARLNRRRAVLAGAMVAGLALGVRERGALWRAAYPYLPRQVQAVPYALRERSWLRSPTRPPLALPTVAVPALESETGPAAATFEAPMAPAISAAAPAAGGATAASSAPDARLPTALGLPAGPHEYQTWNNCGPATVSMAMGRVAQAPGQAAAARELKPDPEDKNVSPDEMAEYVRRKGLGAIVRVNGTLDGLRRLLAVGVPVIVETWFVPEPGDEMGHYRVLVGYNEEAGGFLADDSYNGPGIVLPFDRFDEAWRIFNRVYVVVFPRSLERDIRAVLGDDDERQMYLGAVRTAQAEIVRRADAFGYFNLGSSLLGLGDAAGAADAYDRARAFGLPWRMLWYQFGPFEAYGAIGRWADVADLAETNLHNAPNLEESHYWLGRSLLAQGDADGAALHWREAMRLNPLYVEAAAALSDLDGR